MILIFLMKMTKIFSRWITKILTKRDMLTKTNKEILNFLSAFEIQIVMNKEFQFLL